MLNVELRWKGKMYDVYNKWKDEMKLTKFSIARTAVRFTYILPAL